MYELKKVEEMEVDDWAPLYYRNRKFECKVCYVDEENIYLYVEFACPIKTIYFTDGDIIQLVKSEVTFSGNFYEYLCDNDE